MMHMKTQSVIAVVLIPVLMFSSLIAVGQVTSAQSEPLPNAPKTNAVIQQNYGQLPLSFVPNAGQTDQAVHFQVNSLGGTLFFTPGEVVLSLPQPRKETNADTDFMARAIEADAMPERLDALVSEPPLVVKMQLIGANAEAEIAGADPLPGIVNYFIGNDPSKWHTNIPTYAGVVYRNVYPGIDLQYDGHEGRLKGTYTVAAGIDPSVIQWRYEGNAGLTVDEKSGDLLMALTNGNVLREVAPTAWQERAGKREAVETRYVVDGEEVRFEIGAYDARLPLVIDPEFVYSTFLGGSGNDYAYGIAVDDDGAAYMVGETESLDFPRSGALQNSHAGGYMDIYVTKMSPSGTSISYSTYLGGNDLDRANKIAVDGGGNAYIGGLTQSANFPTVSAFQGSFGGTQDGIVTKLNANGSALIYSTYVGGSNYDDAMSLAVDGDGAAYVVGWTMSTDFPTANAMQATYVGSIDAFVTKIAPLGTSLIYSTYLGGTGRDEAWGIAIDKANAAYIAGPTLSTNFPTLNPIQATKGGSVWLNDGFITKLTATGASLVYSTYLGGDGDDGFYSINVDAVGAAYVVGWSTSENFPLANAIQGVFGGVQDGIVAKLAPNGASLIWASYLGGNNWDAAHDVAVGSDGSAYVIGYTGSPNFPTVNALQSTFGEGRYDAFVAKVTSVGISLAYSTYLGGSGLDDGRAIALDSSGNVYGAGVTSSVDFPILQAYQTIPNGGYDTFVTKLSASDTLSPTKTPTATATGTLDPPSCANVSLLLFDIDPFEDNMFRMHISNANLQQGILTAVSLRWKPTPKSGHMYPYKMLVGALPNSPYHWNVNSTGTPAMVETDGSLDVDSTSPGWFSTEGQTVIMPGLPINTWRVQMANVNGSLDSNLTIYDFVGTTLTVDFPGTGVTCELSMVGVATPTQRPSQTLTATHTATIQASATITSSSTITPSTTPSATITASPTLTPSASATSTLVAAHQDTIGIFRASVSTFYLRNSNTTGYADSQITFGASSYFPITGDWDGDGIDTPGVYKSSTGQFYLTNSTANPAVLSYSFVLGSPGDQPIVGDWDGDGRDGVGVFRPSNGLIYLKNSLTTGFADFTMVLGIPGDVGIAGDWNGDGKDSPGVYRPSNQQFYLSNAICNCSVFADAELGLGIVGDTPFVGDWDGDGKSGVGVYRQSNGLTYIKNALTTGFADASFVFGSASDYPLAGYWVRVSPPAAEAAPTFQPAK